MTGQLLLVAGKPASGKTCSLEGLNNHESVFYLNCEITGKPLPFKNKFNKAIVTDPLQLTGPNGWLQYTLNNNQNPVRKTEIKTVVIDPLNFLMDLYETRYVNNSRNTMKAWGQYTDYFKILMNLTGNLIASDISVVFTAHTADRVNDDEVKDSFVPIKGAVGKAGAEAYFSDIVAAKIMKVSELEKYQNDLLHITDDDVEFGFKHVIQTRLTKDTIGEKIRSNKDMWDRSETFIDGNIQLVLDRQREFYGD